jgi:hypothetical protein
MTMRNRWFGGLILLAALAFLSRVPAQDQAKPTDKHDHGEGPHKGALAEWGEEEYHVEFTVDHKAQQVTVYVLDGSAKKAKPIDAKELILTLKLKPAVTMKLQPSRQASDPPDRSSCYVGKHAALAKEQDFEGTISGKVGNKPYSGDFKEKPHGGPEKQGKSNNPKDRPGEREAALFLTPGGIYTAADIKKNGNVVPSVKFKGMAWAHDDDLKSGDKVCPVTANKADPQCQWYVNGQKYLFCCPPCLEKFVGWAKTQPEKVKPPDQYVK